MASMTWADRRVLVTGNTGFKGTWLCARLLRLGARVSGIALAPAGAHNIWVESGLERDVDAQFVDLRDADAAERAVVAADPEIVFHLAAQPLVRRGYREPVLTYATNVMGTVHLLDAIRRRTSVSTIVAVTSDKVYADAPVSGGYAEAARLGGADPYAGSKAAMELVIESYRAAYFSGGRGPALASARAGNVIGGGDFSEDRLLPDFFRAIERGEALVVRLPDAIRPWQHVLDPLDGYVRLAERLSSEPSAFSGAWNFGPAAGGVAVRDVLEVFARAWGQPEPVWRVEPSGEHETHRLEILADKSRRQLGWEPRWDTPAAVERTAVWYRDYLAGARVADLLERDLIEHASVPVAAPR
jgi:CDP-glucose 4,6-dehydratase